MKILIRRSVLVICMFAVAAQASAEVVLLSQSRSVVGKIWVIDEFGSGYADSDSLSTPDFGLFEEEINSAVFVPLAIAIYSSTQSSEIQSGHFSIHGSATAGAEADGWFYGADAGSYASSDFEVVFEVSTPKLFSLAGTLARSGASLQLDRDGAPYLSFDPVGNDVITVSEDGILEPGAYTLTVNAMAYAQTYFEQFSSFDIDFFMESPVAVDEMSWGQVKSLFR